MTGELYVGGDLVVRGYHQRPQLTAERFLPDPFVDSPNARMYRTGDLARWRRDGNIEFLGRIDDQVKIRGHRIELGEIETWLGRHSALRQAVVVAREETPGDQRLVAYFVSVGNAPSAAELRDYLRQQLPEYMIPAHFVPIDAWPLTPNGKIDRRRLPDLSASLRTTPTTPYAPPSDNVQAIMAGLWREILGLDRVGIDDNFFDVGGHSLLVVRLHRELSRQLPHTISLTDLYRFPTIRSLVGFLQSSDTTDSLQHCDERANLRRDAMARRRRRILDA
jgi:uncharacterized protein YijF (DUF1287 family)